MKKRIASLAMAFVMVFTMMASALPAFAADSTGLTIKADKTEVKAGDTVTYTVTLDAVTDLSSLKFKLDIPTGLTYVDGSGKEVEGLVEQMNSMMAKNLFTEETKIFIIGCDPTYTSDKTTTLMTFQCTVDADAEDDLTVGFVDSEENKECFDSKGADIPCTLTGTSVTVKAEEVKPEPPVTEDTALTMTADKTEVKAGDTVTYTVALDAIKDLSSLKFQLDIPEGLTYVAGSGKEVEGLVEQMNSMMAKDLFTEETKIFIIGCDPAYTSEDATALMTFQCTVDDAAEGTLAVGYEMCDCFDSQDAEIPCELNGATITVKAEEVKPEPPVTEGTALTIKADKAAPKAGEVVTYTVALDAVKDLSSLKFQLDIPEGLTYVAGSGKEAEGLVEQMNSMMAKNLFTEETKTFIVGCEPTYTSDKTTTLMTFQCTVNADAKGELTVGFVDSKLECFDSQDADIPCELNGSTVTVKTEEVKPQPEPQPEPQPQPGGGAIVADVTLKFQTNGGSSIKNITAKAGTAIDLTKYVPTKAGYEFAGWFTDVKLTHQVTSVKLSDNTTVYAKWVQAQKVVFTDVKSTDYFYQPVQWAVANGITSGISATAFGPNVVCTRAQAVTFLWRAAGSPAAQSKVNPFTDVKSSDYFYNAVLWAVENGITAGTSATTFGPNAECTRAQIMTFLWRSQKSPVVVSANPFTDVKSSDYFYNAVLWAVKNGITSGTTATTFSPEADCTRAQIVTFLYQCMGK